MSDLTIQQKLTRKIINAERCVASYSLAKGYLRYEAMRKLDLRTLHELHGRNMQGERWDDMIDALIVNENPHIGSDFNDFLKEEGISLEDPRSLAECIDQGLNPNPNPSGSIPDMLEKSVEKWASAIFDKF